MDFSRVKTMTIPEGSVKQITDSQGRVLGKKSEPVTIHYSTAHGTAPADKVVEKGYTLTSADLPTLSESGGTFNGGNKSIGDVINADITITASGIENPKWHTVGTGTKTLSTNSTGPVDIYTSSHSGTHQFRYTFTATGHKGKLNNSDVSSKPTSPQTVSLGSSYKSLLEAYTMNDRDAYSVSLEYTSGKKFRLVIHSRTISTSTTSSITITKIEEYY